MRNPYSMLAKVLFAAAAVGFVASGGGVLARGGGGGGGGHGGGSGGHGGGGGMHAGGGGSAHFNAGAPGGAHVGSNFAGSGRSFAAVDNFKGGAVARTGGHNWNTGEHFAHAQNNWNHNWNNHWNDWHHHDNVFAGWWWPFAWGWGWGWPWLGWGGYGGYGGNYCYDCAYGDAGYYGSDYGNPTYDTTTGPGLSRSEYQSPTIASDEGTSSQGGVFFAQAEDAFRQGDYRVAIRLAHHAAVDSPRNPKTAELMSLAMFASGDYRGAAVRARAALAFGPPASWQTILDYYGGAEPTYTTQLRSLENHVRENPSAPEGHFLLGYQYLTTGYDQAAMKQFDAVQKIAPDDKFTGELVQKLSGEPADNEAPPPPPQSAGRGAGKLQQTPQSIAGRGAQSY